MPKRREQQKQEIMCYDYVLSSVLTQSQDYSIMNVISMTLKSSFTIIKERNHIPIKNISDNSKLHKIINERRVEHQKHWSQSKRGI